MLTDEQSLSYLGALPRMFAAVGRNLEDLLAAYRSGGGVSWEQLGADARESQAATNRPWFDRSSARPWPVCPRCTLCCPRPAAGSPTSGVARAGPPSRWPGPIPGRR